MPWCTSSLASFDAEGRLVGWYRRTVNIPADAFDGISVAHGRLYAVGSKGELVCME